MDLDIYSYAEPREFLAAVLAKKKERNPRFSLRAWSRQLGYKNPSLLSAVLRGDRPLKPDLAARIVQTIGGKEDELKYFELLVLIKNAKSLVERESYIKILETIRPGQRFFNLELEKFRMLSEWYHFAILEMISLKGFQNDIDWIARRLGGGITAAMVRSGIDRLLRLGLVEEDESGALFRTHAVMEVGDDIPSDAIRSHHLQMIDRAKAAVTDQELDERYVIGSTIAITQENLEKAKSLIEDFYRKLSKLGAQEDADEVYRINTQAFRLTASKRPEVNGRSH